MKNTEIIKCLAKKRAKTGRFEKEKWDGSIFEEDGEG